MPESAPLNPEAIGARSKPTRISWTARDCMLYALGVGAGAEDLAYTTNNTKGVEQKMVPTMPVTLGVDFRVLKQAGTIDWARLLHAEQNIELLSTIPVQGEADAVTEIKHMWDKGKAALVVAETTATSTNGEPLWRSTASLFIRGAGGWGGDRGPSQADAVDHAAGGQRRSITYQTRPEQALIYRLSGDYNPLHSDPAFAARAGMDRPILHGLCTFGFAGRAVLEIAGHDSALTAMSARFAAPVWPGDTLRVELWQPEDTTIQFTVRGRDDREVLTAGLAKVER